MNKLIKKKKEFFLKDTSQRNYVDAKYIFKKSAQESLLNQFA